MNPTSMKLPFLPENRQVGSIAKKRFFLLLFLVFCFQGNEIFAQVNALHFDGIDDRVEIPDNSALDFTHTGTYTLECWIKPSGFNFLAGIISKFHTSNANGYFLRLKAEAPYTGIDFDNMQTADGVLSADTWYHLAAVNNGGTRTLYVNGVPQALTGSPWPVAANNNQLAIGVDYLSSPRYFNGVIDEVRIWSTARSQADIQDNMGQGISPSSPELVAYYKMDAGVPCGDNAGLTQITDATGNGHHGTVINFALNGSTSNLVNGYIPRNVLFVDEAATGGNSGSNWENALTSLADAFAIAGANPAIDSILVATGTYYPEHFAGNGSHPRDIAFVLPANVKVLGGYPSGGGIRHVSNHPVVLHGDIDKNNIPDDGNVSHVVIAAGDLGTAELDGFTITGGNAASLNTITVNGKPVGHHQGGAIYTEGASIVIRNCTFTGNQAQDGGAISNHSASPVITSCHFVGNTAASGGAIHNTGTVSDPSSPVIINCLFTGNGSAHGGVLYNDSYSAPTAVNCTFYGNTASAGNSGVVYNNNASVSTIINSILYANGSIAENAPGSSSQITYSITEGGHDGDGNLDADPQLTDPGNGDFSLQPDSPAVNAGDNSVVTVLTDLAGNYRIRYGNVDMGAYEVQTGSILLHVAPDANGILYVVKGAGGTGSSWSDALGELADALLGAKQLNDDAAGSVTQIWVAKGTYFPIYNAGDGTDERDRAFVLPENVQVYGGFDPSNGIDDLTDTRLLPSADGGATVLSGDFDRDDNITGNGGSLVITGNSENAYHVVVATGNAGTARLDGFIITGGNADRSGNIEIDGATVYGNHGGGLISVAAFSPVIINCTFTGNSAFNGGGIASRHPSLQELTVNSCSFTKNSAINTGGGIYNRNSSNTSVISHCLFTGNLANYGAGLFNLAASPLVSHCTFSGGNKVNFYGGAVYNQNGSSPVFESCTFAGGAAQYGAGMFNDNASPGISNCVFVGNQSIYNAGALFNDAASVASIVNSTFSANSAAPVFNRNASLTLTNSIVYGNGSGHGIVNENATSTVTYSLVQGMPADEALHNLDGQADHSLFTDTGNPAGPDGVFGTPDDGFSLLFCSPAVNAGSNDDAPASGMDIAGSARIGNITVDLGAYEVQSSFDPIGTAVYVDGANGSDAHSGTSWQKAFKTLSYALEATQNILCYAGVDSILVAEGTYYPTGGQSGDDRDRTLLVKRGLKILGGYPAGGGARNPQVYPVYLDGNINDAGTNTDNSHHIMVIAGLPAEADSVVVDGFIFRYGSATGEGDVSYNGVPIGRNFAGGLIAIHNANGEKIRVSNCTFTENMAVLGCGMVSYHSDTRIVNCSFTHNTTGSNAFGTSGGGLYIEGGAPVVDSCIFENNFSGYGGGGMAIMHASGAMVSNSTFSGNHSAFRGGGGLRNISSNVHVTNCTFTGNKVSFLGTADTDGGGIYNHSSIVTVRDCIFSHNTITGMGGGIYNRSSDLHLSNSIFYRNLAVGNGNGYGGGLYNFANFDRPVSVSNCTFLRNESRFFGGAVFNSSSYNFRITNTIVWGNISLGDHNTAPQGPGLYTDYTSTFPVVSYSLIQGHTGGEGNITPATDPLFTDIDNAAGADGIWRTPDDGLTLQFCSPAANAGTPDTTGLGLPAWDLAGQARIFDGRIDIGAYEFQDISLSSAIYVDDAAGSDDNNGASWGTAFKTLSQALRKVNNTDCYTGVDSILVATGTYYPTGAQAGDDRDSTFLVKRGGLKLLGGYPTGGGVRNAKLHPVYLDGNINNPATADDNSYHIMVVAGLPADADSIVIDGFTFRNGQATGTGDKTYNDVAMGRGFAGGLIVINNSNGEKITVRNCSFTSNTAIRGGGMVVYGNSIRLENCIFTNNQAISGNMIANGGGLYAEGGAPIVAGCLFAGNSSAQFGGGISNYLSEARILNSTFSGNTAASGGGIYSNDAGILHNTIIWGNSSGITDANSTLTVGHSIVQGGFGGDDNIDADPLFINSTAGDYRPAACSPAVNSEDNLQVPDWLTTDLDGTSRILFSTVDRGAYEAVSDTPDQSAVITTENLAITASQNSNGVTVYANDCFTLVAVVTGQGGGNAIGGATTAKVWIAGAQPSRHVKRHYEISPDENAETATGRVTLYFTQEEFDAFNDINTLKLPTGPADAEGIGNLRIEKHGGKSEDHTGLPGTYPGMIIIINPDDEDILWNATTGRWEITLDITGFSGFFVKTGDEPLPVRWISFDGYFNDRQQAVLNWTVNETSVSHYEVEKSADGRSFRSLARIPGKGDGIHRYTFTGVSPVPGSTYYRIRQTDTDGTYSFSKIISLAAPAGQAIVPYPNPVRNRVTVVMGENYHGTVINVVNIAGNKLQTIPVEVEKVTIDLSGYAPGIYLLQTEDGQLVRILKE